MAAALLLAVAASAIAGTRTINFDDATLAPCTFSETSPLTTRYTATMGVTFAGPAPGEGGAILDQCGGFGVTGHSAPKFLAFNLSSGYPKPPETITFAQPIHTFEIKAGQNGSGGTFTITGFDGATPVSVNSRSSTQNLSVLTLAATRMTSVKLEYVPGSVQYMIFDDIKFGTAPVSGNESYEVTQGQTLEVAAANGVLANDSDADGDPLTPTVSRQPGNGAATLRDDGSFTYTPNPAFFGTDSFAYKAGDGTGSGNEATVTIKVNQLPPPPPPPAPPAAPTKIIITMPFAFSKSTKRFTKFTLLQVKGVPRGSTLKAVCKAPKRKKCPGGKRFTKKNARGAVNLKKWSKKKLRAGTKLTVTVTKTGNYIGAVKIMKVRKKKRPSFADRCLPPGAKKPARC